MAITVGVLVFDGVEEMDFAGPWEVLACVMEGRPDDRILLVSERTGPVVCDKGMRVLPDVTYQDCPPLDVIVIPGGSGARRETGNRKTVAWLRKIAPGCTWITSVCTGTFLLVGSGIAGSRRVTTHHQFIQLLRDTENADVAEGVRIMRDGNIVTAGGVMSGIEMSLWLVGQLFGPDAVSHARDYIAYDFPPRESQEVAVAGN